MGKRETDRNEQFLLFLQSFPLNQIFISSFVHISLFAADMEEPQIGLSGKGLRPPRFYGKGQPFQMMDTDEQKRQEKFKAR